MRRIGLVLVAALSGLFVAGYVSPARAGDSEVKISLTWTTDTDSVRGAAPPLGALRSKRIHVVSLGDARTGDDPRVIGARVELGGERVRLWTQDDVAESSVAAARDLLADWGATLADDGYDLVLGIALADCSVVEDDTYDAEVVLRARLETADRRLVWQGQVEGTAQRTGRRERESLYGEALSAALARAVSNIVNSTGLQEALLNDHPPHTASRAAFRASGTGSIVTGSLAEQAPRDGTPTTTVRYVYPAPPAGTVVAAPGPQGTVVTQMSGFAEAPIKDAAKPAASAAAVAEPPKPVAVQDAPKPVEAAKGGVSPRDFVLELEKLAQSGAGPDLVAAFAKQRTIAGEFTADDVIAMHEAGLPEVVVRAALEKGR